MTLLIKNVRIVGGSRPFPEPCDVFVSGEKISAIGHFPNKPADRVLDGLGAYLSPGFIDVNASSDHYLTLLEYPGQEDFLRQGVTTVFGGMCGASLAPLIYGGLESFRKWGSTDRVNVDWHSMAEFLASIDRRPLGVNFGTMVGHGTIRRAITGDAVRDLTKNELAVFKNTLEAALREGGFGLSTGLEYIHARPASYGELKALLEVVKRYDGVHATHVRDTKAMIDEAVDEAVKLARETGVPTLISHFVPLAGFEQPYEKAFEMIEALPPDVALRFDLHPSLYTMAPIYTFLPSWAQADGFKKMREELNDEWMLRKIERDMPPISEDDFMVAQAPGHEFWIGKTLRELKQVYGVPDGRTALLMLMKALDMRGAALYKNIREPLLLKAMEHWRSFIGSNAPSFAFAKDRRLKPEHATSTFTSFLGLVERTGIMPIEDAVRKITAEPAAMFGLAGRGVIQEGYFADLACFKDGDVKFTVVNGGVAAERDGHKGALRGKALRRRSLPKSR
ncbi:MAG TPA: hypothetical protein VMT99_01355 [Candidatus Paceibacterota bacterium]|nr:hypothetical protein [Candidatus Paceibacterota bacterium]